MYNLHVLFKFVGSINNLHAYFAAKNFTNLPTILTVLRVNSTCFQKLSKKSQKRIQYNHGGVS